MGLFDSIEERGILDDKFTHEELGVIQLAVASLPMVNERLRSIILTKCKRGRANDQSKQY